MKPSFVQDFPPPPDLYAVDRALHAELKRRLPADVAVKAAPVLEAMGKSTASDLHALTVRAEAEPPQHVPYDPWGRRVDHIKVSPAWDELKAHAARHGVVATGYDESFGAHRRVVQAALLHTYSASSAVFSCPLAMTDAATRVLMDLADPATRERLVPRLTSRDPSTFITSGQWMTERTGGSDVSQTSTVARQIAGDRYALHGVKWFTSATTSEMALALARIETNGSVVDGSRGLTLFAVDLARDEHGALKGIQVNRLKDKLGTRALPTAELTLQGVEATRIGEIGRGVASVSGMLNVTRFYNAVASSSGMHKAQALARAYAWKREAFGGPIASHALHAATLDWMEAETAGALALVMEIAALLGKSESGLASDDEKKRLRALVPIAKLTTAKQAVAVASEALEAFGGAGYIEDTGLPSLLRDAQVLPIWEGTTNVLSLDVLRAESRDGGFSALLQDTVARVEKLSSGALAKDAVELVRNTTRALVETVQKAATEGMGAVEKVARKVALTTGHVTEAMLLAETAQIVGKDANARFETFTRAKLGGPLG
jgi:alkylation response protein AidB-like acyl-CoA dehydrogenase